MQTKPGGLSKCVLTVYFANKYFLNIFFIIKGYYRVRSNQDRWEFLALK